jgi:hypothetical protein
MVIFYFFRRIEVYIGRLNESTILAKNIAKNMKTPKLGMFFPFENRNNLGSHTI